MQIDGKKWKHWDIFLGSKITVDSDYSHEIKRHLLLGRKAVTNLDSILESRDITLPTRAWIVKAMVFPVVMYGCENWTIRKAECWRIDTFELWCWRRLPWTARRSNQSILKETSPEYSLEGLMLNLKLQYFGYQIGARHLKTHWFSLVCFLYYISRILNCKEIQQVHPKGNQSWMLIGRTDVEAETTILWPPDAKSWLIWKDPDAGKDWRQEKGTTEDEMVGWHHWLNGQEFE